MTLRSVFAFALVLLGGGLGASLPASAQRVLAPGEVLRGRFVQERFLQGFDAPLRSEGTFVLDLGQGLLWRTETPFAVTTVLSAAGIVQEVRGAETMRLSADRIPLLAGLYSVLSGALGGDVASLGRIFRAERHEENGIWRVVLSPAEAPAPALPIEQIVIGGRTLVDDVQIRRRNGDRDHIGFIGQEVSLRALDAAESRLLQSPGRP